MCARSATAVWCRAACLGDACGDVVMDPLQWLLSTPHVSDHDAWVVVRLRKAFCREMHTMCTCVCACSRVIC